jgi:hypothetical protein
VKKSVRKNGGSPAIKKYDPLGINEQKTARKDDSSFLEKLIADDMGLGGNVKITFVDCGDASQGELKKSREIAEHFTPTSSKKQKLPAVSQSTFIVSQANKQDKEISIISTAKSTSALFTARSAKDAPTLGLGQRKGSIMSGTRRTRAERKNKEGSVSNTSHNFAGKKSPERLRVEKPVEVAQAVVL